MWLPRFRNLIRGPRRPQQPAPRSLRRRLLLEQLEDRSLPSTFSAAGVADLITDINASNQTGGNNTILLAANTTFDLTAVNNTTNGANGLPVITANDNLTISGQGGGIIQRDTAAPAFRLFDVAAGASLNLQNLTLQGGLAFGVGVSANGGALYNQGTLDLNGVTVQGNSAQGQNGTGASAAGGGIYSADTLTLEGGTLIQNNQAVGGQGYKGSWNSLLGSSPGGPGGNGLGGGLYVEGGTANLTNVTLYANTAQGGQGGPGFAKETVCSFDFGCFLVGATDGGAGGNGLGGGLYGAGGTATLSSDTVSWNTARGGAGGKGGSGGGHNGSPGVGEGGGISIAASAAVMLDAFTLTNTKHNTPDNIYGTYTQS